MTLNAPVTPRRALAVSSVVLGAVATLMIIVFWVIGGTTDGKGLSGATVLAVLFFYASAVVGIVAALLGIAAVVWSRPRLLGVIGIILGIVPIIVVAVSSAIHAG